MNMSNNVCDRLTVLEERREADRRSCDEDKKTLNNLCNKYDEIMLLLIKIKFTLYGGACFLVASEFGILSTLKKGVGL